MKNITYRSPSESRGHTVGDIYRDTKIDSLLDKLDRTNEELKRKTDKLGHLKMTLSLLQKSEIQQLTERIDKAQSEIGK
jgi:peptidoglycan hydrolase CwlO-like protein